MYVTVWINLRDPVTAKQKLLWPGDRIVTPVAALSIACMGVTTPWCTEEVAKFFWHVKLKKAAADSMQLQNVVGKLIQSLQMWYVTVYTTSQDWKEPTS